MSVVLTFDPHPARVLGPGRAPAALTTLAQKEELLARLGVDRLAVLPFDAEVARLPPAQFAREVLQGALGARHVVVGEAFRFGHRREGDARALEALGEALGFTVRPLPPVLEQGSPVSSSRVRDALARGDVRTARDLLGRPYFVDATRGAGRREGAHDRRPDREPRAGEPDPARQGRLRGAVPRPRRALAPRGGEPRPPAHLRRRARDASRRTSSTSTGTCTAPGSASPSTSGCAASCASTGPRPWWRGSSRTWRRRAPCFRGRTTKGIVPRNRRPHDDRALRRQP